MKKLLFGLILILTISCNNNTETSKSKIDTSNYQKIKVGFLGRAIFVPKDYESVTLDEYKAILEALNKTPTDDMKVSWYRLEMLKTNYSIFVNKENQAKSIWLILGEHVPLDESLASQYIEMLTTSMSMKALQEGYEFNLIEKEFIKTMNSKIIKVKFLKSNEIIEQYTTQYIITIGYQTFTIMVNSDVADEDFEEAVKLIQ